MQYLIFFTESNTQLHKQIASYKLHNGRVSAHHRVRARVSDWQTFAMTALRYGGPKPNGSGCFIEAIKYRFLPVTTPAYYV